jgi:hypothetical protein
MVVVFGVPAKGRPEVMRGAESVEGYLGEREEGGVRGWAREESGGEVRTAWRVVGRCAVVYIREGEGEFGMDDKQGK